MENKENQSNDTAVVREAQPLINGVEKTTSEDVVSVLHRIADVVNGDVVSALHHIADVAERFLHQLENVPPVVVSPLPSTTVPTPPPTRVTRHTRAQKNDQCVYDVLDTRYADVPTIFSAAKKNGLDRNVTTTNGITEILNRLIAQGKVEFVVLGKDKFYRRK